jgi:hypothetical protein
MISFEAEVKEAKAARTVSMDKEITIKLVTDQQEALALEKFIAAETVIVKVYTMEELAIMDKKGLIKVPEVLKNEKES